MHQACDGQSICSRCGGEYEIYQRPVADPVGDAVVPRGLRPNGSGAAVAMILMAAALIILMLIFFMMLFERQGSG